MNYILILGASSDIARATAHIFAANGFGLHLAARNIRQLEVIAQDLRLRYDVPVSTWPFEATAYDKHGDFWNSLSPKPLVTLSAFGYLGEQQKAQQNWQEAKDIIEVNYTGAVSILNQVAESYARLGRGTIIGISSVAGERGRQSNYFYGSAKAAFTAYLSGLRNRLYKSGAHVITVKPGFVRTRMTEGLDLPALLTATPEQVAKAVYKAYRSKKDVIYTLSVWQLIMQNIRMIPESVFKKMEL